MSEPLIVIGNGMAAARLVEELAKRALGRYAIAVIGDEPRLAYNRVLLSALLAEEVGFSDLELKPARWWRDRGVTLRYGVRATEIDAIARTVRLADGTQLPFSKLVLATGSQPIKLAIPGMELPGVLTFRDVDDVNTIAASKGRRVVVIGGGLLGLEAAYGLAKARRGRHRRPSHGPADGAPARSARGACCSSARWKPRASPCGSRRRPRASSAMAASRRSS